MARKILLADDSVTAQNMGRKILADAGYEVIAVNNGSAALKKIIELKPDLVILDVYMPGYSGLEVCQRLKESQETARIPVLLTVGKLEPFKPEEAQRVRAEGFVVKPFEASELLSALSKLEDKVVPRPEPSKPGRFARAIAADAENANARSSSETGWKSRIGFPAKKSEEEQAENESAGSPAKKEKGRESSPEPETRIDVAAFGPIGIPKDVTPAEVAAITAAAAQIQMAEGVAKSGSDNSEAGSESKSEKNSGKSSVKSFEKIPAGSGEFSVEPSPEQFQDSRSANAESSESAALSRSSVTEAVSEQPAAAPVSPAPSAAELNQPSKKEIVDRHSADDTQAEDAPVTMAVTSEAAGDTASPRWTAVPVTLGAEESSLSLEHEMQKAYAAADYATSAGSVEAAPAKIENSLPDPLQSDAQVSTKSESEAIPESQPVSQASPSKSEAFSRQETASEQIHPPATTGIPSNNSDFASDSTSSDATTAPVVEASSETSVSSAVPQVQSASDPQPAVTSEEREPVSADTSSPKADSETVKTTAAAWASWRQIRDTEKTEAPAPQPDEPAAESTSTDTAARAVAAGAEQALQEADSAPTENPQDVASIVDSVLAGLRPKLMEEITRKMSEKK